MTEMIVIALENFWELQDEMARLAGVREVTVGYVGGTVAQPTYHTKGDHQEALKILFNPREISFEEVLRHALTYHYGPESGAVIFYIDEQERRRAQVVSDELEQRGEMVNMVRLEPLTVFYKAEDYQQNMIAKLRGDRNPA